jgi:hypothetical protein
VQLNENSHDDFQQVVPSHDALDAKKIFAPKQPD